MITSPRRRWLRPPRLRTLEADEGERHATWLELFFDLVFVISIAEVVHTLEDYRSLADFLGTAGLFVAVWWAWVGYTVYADRFDTDDILHRVLVLAGMLAVIAMALSVHDALHGGSTQFALTFVAVRGIVLLLNARARRHAAAARPLLNLFLVAFSVGASLWLVSLLLPEPWRYVLWGVALVVELSAPWLGRRQIVKAPVHASHLVERFGLFTLIVLGESVISVAQGAANVNWTAGTLTAAVAGFVAVASLWWLYFDRIDDGGVRSVLRGLVWNYAHLPLLAGLVSVAVGTEYAVRETAGGLLERSTTLALGGGTAVYLVATVVIGLAVRRTADRVLWLWVGSAAVALALGLLWPLGVPLGLLALVDVVLVGLVVVEVVGRPPAEPEAGAHAQAAVSAAGEARRL
ncbi:MAG TPA: low temperature requirement protein A [Actinomycetes bacterium]|nr:low temperature requirement protein A [Actinomycetes bacterium]